MTYKIGRTVTVSIEADLKKKIVLLAGPRQVGKTELSKALLTDHSRYLNWDFDLDREEILKAKWPQGPGLIVLDEIHKFSNWRNSLKGLFDKRRNEVQILVTGSARLEYYSYGGDSMQGRYYLHHLFPLTVAELGITTRADFDSLLKFSGFPEPFNSGSEVERKRWSRNYRSLLVREDLRDLERVTDIGKIEQLALRLPELVASPLSYNSLREDLGVAHKTVVDWCNILERLFFIFKIFPFSNSRIRSLKKMPKHYHFDWALVDQVGPALENLVAVHLLNWCQFQIDVFGKDMRLAYFRDLEKREVDFIILEDDLPVKAIECKKGFKGIDPSLRYFKSVFPATECIQVELDCEKPYQNEDGIKVTPLISFLSALK